MLLLSLWGAGFSARGGERVSLLNNCPLTSFYKGRGRALINLVTLGLQACSQLFFNSTPVVTGEGLEVKDLSWMNWVRPVR